MAEFSLRSARPDELQQIVAIDDQATGLFAEAGLDIALDKEHPFVVAESLRWANAIEEGRAHVAVNCQDIPIGFATFSIVDGEPYLDQLAVLPRNMRCGVGTSLLNHAISWSGGRSLWLTTYAHLPWNGPYYQRHGFATIKESECGPELRAVLWEQRLALPNPDQRIAMVRRFHSIGTYGHSPASPPQIAYPLG
ncbi:GNAT family N-acetyltransferase [Synechococcus sp. CCY9201]|uniref:GNAT family N-acetyltransferase n=1 Tax=Synechococcus sp. CCY9201 TaxID=174697 RepID=UPI002B208F01|nr:GNAT family N-acetyltransferase [Synechococcus sp. CCY9201]MEA5474744.1 GNAT family N-acetyltransferase [Synechococcus sp. CCY9201]